LLGNSLSLKGGCDTTSVLEVGQVKINLKDFDVEFVH
jgi:hypothetical protein